MDYFLAAGQMENEQKMDVCPLAERGLGREEARSFKSYSWFSH